MNNTRTRNATKSLSSPSVRVPIGPLLTFIDSGISTTGNSSMGRSVGLSAGHSGGGAGGDDLELASMHDGPSEVRLASSKGSMRHIEVWAGEEHHSQEMLQSN